MSVYSPSYPRQPRVNNKCRVNQTFKTLPEGQPRSVTPLGPTSMKNIYGTNGHYPLQHILRPVGTMYDTDLAKYDKYGNLLKSHYMVYPVVHRSVDDVIESGSVIQYPFSHR